VAQVQRRSFITAAGIFLAGSAMRMQAAEPSLILDGDTHDGSLIEVQDSDLMALPQSTFETSTLWTAGVDVFSGPKLSDVLSHYGSGQGDLILTALNNYNVTMARNMVTDVAPILANRINGEPFSRREKGPLWVIFPFDQHEEFRTENVYAVSVWQLSRITVIKA
jgi:hypothetical protein